MPKVLHKSERIALAVTPAMVARLEAIAPTAESSRSELIRRAIEDALNRAEGEQAPDPAA